MLKLLFIILLTLTFSACSGSEDEIRVNKGSNADKMKKDNSYKNNKPKPFKDFNDSTKNNKPKSEPSQDIDVINI